MTLINPKHAGIQSRPTLIHALLGRKLRRMGSVPWPTPRSRTCVCVQPSATSHSLICLMSYNYSGIYLYNYTIFNNIHRLINPSLTLSTCRLASTCLGLDLWLGPCTPGLLATGPGVHPSRIPYSRHRLL